MIFAYNGRVTVPLILVIVALILALIDEAQARGTSLLGWAVVLLCISELWTRLT